MKKKSWKNSQSPNASNEPIIEKRKKYRVIKCYHYGKVGFISSSTASANKVGSNVIIVVYLKNNYWRYQEDSSNFSVALNAFSHLVAG